jgi:PAS domain S-box-containing protein
MSSNAPQVTGWTVLVIDDMDAGADPLSALLRSEGYAVVRARSGPEALELAGIQPPDVVLLDVMMPVMDGFEVCRRLRATPGVETVPILMLTALGDRDSRLRGLDAGADHFLTKPFDWPELKLRLRTVTRLNRFRQLAEERAKVERLILSSPDGIAVVDPDGRLLLANPAVERLFGHAGAPGTPAESVFSEGAAEHFRRWFTGFLAEPDRSPRVEIELMPAARVVELHAAPCTWDGRSAIQLQIRDVTPLKSAERALRGMHASLLESYEATLAGWVHALDLRDNETEGHTRRVTEMAARLAERLGFTGDALVNVRRGALLHDIGKIGIPDAILRKPGPLDAGEFAIMRRHPILARDMLKGITFLEPALDIPYFHHERWDGTGYPEGRAGTDIPLSARLFAVVDVFDALSSHRPYRAAWSADRVLSYLRSESGSHFDPEVVPVFLGMVGQGASA